MSGSKSQNSNASESQNIGSGFNAGGNVQGGVNIGQSSNVGFNQGVSSGSSSSSSSSSSNDRIWDKQSPFLEDKYQQAQNMYNTQQPQLANEAAYAGGNIRSVQDAASNQWQNSLSDGNVNSYTDAMKQSIATDAGNAQNQMLSSMDARAAASGMSGGARHGQAIGQGMTGINDSMLKNQANIGFQAEEAARGRQMQALGMSNDMANLGLQGFNPMNAEWSGLNNYNQIIGGPTKLTNSSSSSSNSSNQSSNNFGANFGNSQNLGFNFGMGSNYGENYNTNASDAEGGGWTMSGGM